MSVYNLNLKIGPPSGLPAPAPCIARPFSRGSILMMLERVISQVEYHCFADLRTKQIDPFYKELCLIIAEVLVLDPASLVKINGSLLSAHLVQEVFSQLHNEHIRMVFDNFQNLTSHIYNKRSYLRTALYNAVFELEFNVINSPF